MCDKYKWNTNTGLWPAEVTFEVFSLLSKTTSIERPHESWVALYRFHCIWHECHEPTQGAPAIISHTWGILPVAKDHLPWETTLYLAWVTNTVSSMGDKYQHRGSGHQKSHLRYSACCQRPLTVTLRDHIIQWSLYIGFTVSGMSDSHEVTQGVSAIKMHTWGSSTSAFWQHKVQSVGSFVWQCHVHAGYEFHDTSYILISGH